MEKQVLIKTMKAVRFHKYGKPETLVVDDDVSVPQPKANQALVRIRAVAVNPYDWKVRSGMYEKIVSLVFPSIPGLEASGIIEALGDGVSRYKKGDEVYGNIKNSTAEFAVADIQNIHIKPTHLSFEEAAAIPVASQTAYSALFDLAHLKQTERILVHAAAGSVGVFAVQLAKWKGAYVICTSSAENVRFLKSIGADEVIDYHTNSFEELVKDVDVVFDGIGGDVWDNSFKVLKKGGRLVSITHPAGSEENEKKYGVKAMYRNSGISPEGIKILQILVEDKKLKPFVREVLPIEKLPEAHTQSEKLHGRGKIIIKIS